MPVCSSSFLLPSLLHTFVLVVITLKKIVCVCVWVCVAWRKAGVNGKEEDKLN